MKGILLHFIRLLKVLSKHSTIMESKYTAKKKSLGSGGNATVYKVKRCEDNQEFALKSLAEPHMNNKEKCSRFRDEIRTLLNCKNIEGVIPIVDHSIKGLWYVMPIAEDIDSHLKSIVDNVECVLQIADTLSQLHKCGFSHRDIKPSNILFYNNRYVLCDFGLVDIPDKTNILTKSGSRIGSMSTIAPEMKRNAKKADGKKADVYSLAKTLWILLTKEKQGFDGAYNFEDSSIALSSYSDLKSEHLVEIEELLRLCTQNEPSQRPSMDEFSLRLKKWKDIRNDEMKMSQSNWNFLKKRIFGDNGIFPSECKWDTIEEIVAVLGKLNRVPISRYMFFPNGGEMDFTSVELASEKDCIDIHSRDFIFRVKPKDLIFENFSVSAWNYFLLELKEQSPVVGDSDEYSEKVVEDTPGHYVSATDYDYGVYDYDSGKPLPTAARQIVRYLKGKILFVLKLGPYNFINENADGRHSNCTSEQFREYIARLEFAYKLKHKIEDKVWKELKRRLVEGCPFKPNKPKDLVTEIQEVSEEKDYIKKHYKDFDFSDLIASISPRKEDSVIEYHFKLEHSESSFFEELFSSNHYFLCSNGRIEYCCDGDTKQILSVYDTNEAYNIYTAIRKKFREQTEGKLNVFELTDFCVDIRRIGKPSHLFSKDEIKKLMEEADDRVNNTLVIDGDGYAKIIQNGGETPFYPVVHETWCSRNVYVGKYSTLSDMDSAYHYCLTKWCDYLETKEGQPREDYDSCNLTETELLHKINDIITSEK